MFLSENNSSSGGSAGEAPQYKLPASGKSGVEAAKDVPSWAKGNRPMVGENGKSFAKRLLDQKYGEGQWNDTGPGSEYSKIKKWVIGASSIPNSSLSHMTDTIHYADDNFERVYMVGGLSRAPTSPTCTRSFCITR
jgi:hypothetical protein